MLGKTFWASENRERSNQGFLSEKERTQGGNLPRPPSHLWESGNWGRHSHKKAKQKSGKSQIGSGHRGTRVPRGGAQDGGSGQFIYYPGHELPQVYLEGGGYWGFLERWIT